MPDMNVGAGFARAELSMLPALHDAPELYALPPPPDDPTTLAQVRDDNDFGLRAASKATALTSRLMDAPPDMAKGLTAALLQRFDEDSAALTDNAPSPQAEEQARAAIGRARGRLLDWALPQEAAATSAARRQGLIDTLAQFRAAAEADPDAVDSFHAEGDEAIRNAAGWLGEREAQQLGGQWTHELYGNVASVLTDRDPVNTSALLSAGFYGDRLPPEKRGALLDRADRLLKNASFDGQLNRQIAQRDDVVGRAQQQQSFLGDFTEKVKAGTARAYDLGQASAQGIISAYEERRLRKKLEAEKAFMQQQNDAVMRVQSFMDGKSTDTPSAHDIAAHYRLVMSPILEKYSPDQRGAAVVNYMKSFGRLNGVNPVHSEADFSSPSDEPVAREDVYRLAGYDPNGFSQKVEFLRNFPGSWAVKTLSDKALEETQRLFNGMPQGDTAADAFRHAYWAYESARQAGPDVARALTNAHERDGGGEGARLMDLFNNAVGIKLGTLPENKDRDGRDVILAALLEGKLQLQPFKLK